MGRIYGNNEWWGLRLLHKRSVQTSSCTQAPIDFVTFCLSRPRVRQPLLPPAPPFGTKAKEESFVAELVFPRANKRDEGVLTGKKKRRMDGENGAPRRSALFPHSRLSNLFHLRVWHMAMTKSAVSDSCVSGLSAFAPSWHPKTTVARG